MSPVTEFLLVFIPLLVAIDVWGILPLYISLTEGMTEEVKKELVTQATLTAFAIAVGFLILGNLIFDFLAIRPSDFQIAGGIVLLVLAITDLLFSKEEERRRPLTSYGVVPLGVPLIMGPAALTTLMVLLDTVGYLLTCLSLFLNLIIVWITFRFSHLVVKVIGKGGSRAIAKVMSLFLAAIGVKLIRIGLTAVLEHS